MKYLVVHGMNNLGWTEEIEQVRPDDFLYFNGKLYDVISINDLVGEVAGGHRVIRLGTLYADVESGSQRSSRKAD